MRTYCTSCDNPRPDFVRIRRQQDEDAILGTHRILKCEIPCHCGGSIYYVEEEEMIDPRLETLEKLKGRLLVAEGFDMTGKTSVSKLLVERLRASGIESIFTFQPGDGRYGEHASTIRSFCKEKKWDIHPLANYLLFLADKVEVCSKVIKPALERGETVISDRWSYSTVAYQIFGKELYKELPDEVWEFLDKKTVLDLEPDFVFYFPEQLQNTERKHDAGDQWETAGDAFNHRVRRAYENQFEDGFFTFKNGDSKTQWIRVLPAESAEATLERLLDQVAALGE